MSAISVLPEPVGSSIAMVCSLRKVAEYKFSLHGQSYRFQKGHRIMVQVQSSWFPLIDRNPQTFVPNIFEAKASDYRAATQRVYRSAKYPSHIVMPIISAPVP